MVAEVAQQDEIFHHPDNREILHSNMHRGGRSCADTRTVSAEEFGLGRKFSALTYASKYKLKKTTFRPYSDVFCSSFETTRKKVFCRELANTRLTKELNAFIASAESLPTSATLVSAKC